jgi:N-acetylmuramoyl-L-alanine amidase
MTPKITGLIISSGHTNVASKDRGASSPDGKYIEGVLTVLDKNILVSEINKAAIREGIKDISKYLLVDRDDTALSETMAFLKDRTKSNDLLIDIHYNSSGNTSVKGTEVLIPEKYTAEELEIADRISDIINNILGTNERGIIGRADGVKTEADSARKKLGWMRLTGINILIELEFLSNPDAMKILAEKRNKLWEDVASYIVGLLKQSI